MKLTKQDEELILLAGKIAKKNIDLYPKENFAVGCVVKAKSGKIYKGVNLKTAHSVCAEQVAIGQAFACGERELETIVAVRFENDETRVISPCGLCRYIFNQFNLNFNVIVEDVANRKVLKVKAKDLLPYPYKGDLPKKVKKIK